MADLLYLRTFLAIHRTGSLTAAGKALHLSQPAVSHHLKALEVDVGRPLFLRLARGVAPTPAAQDLARAIAFHLDALEAVSHSLSPRSVKLEGTVLLGGPADFLSVRALPALAPLAARGIRLRCRTGLTARLVHALAEAELDLVIATERHAQPGVTFEPFTTEDFVLVGAPGGPRIPVSRLHESPFVAFADELPIVRRYFRAALGRRLSGAASVVIDDLRGVREAVKAGAGISVLPRYLVERELAAGELVELHRPKVPVTNALYLATRSGAAHHPRVALVRDALYAAR